MKTISATEAYDLVQEVGSTKAELEGSASVRFTLTDGRQLVYTISGFSEGCETCGYGGEAIISAYLE